jgi:hypothetical protein
MRQPALLSQQGAMSPPKSSIRVPVLPESSRIDADTPGWTGVEQDEPAKRCSRCGRYLGLSEFPRDRGRKDGRMSQCRECASERSKDYYERHRAEVLAKAEAKRRAAGVKPRGRSERVRKPRSAYPRKPKTLEQERWHNFRRADRDRELFSLVRRRDALVDSERECFSAVRYRRRRSGVDWSDPEQRNAYARELYQRRPENWFKAAHRRRARIAGAAVVEEVSRRGVLDRDGWKCRVCGVAVRDDVARGHPRKAIMAHIVALKAGGDHSWANVACLCHGCNCRDGVNRIPIQFALT